MPMVRRRTRRQDSPDELDRRLLALLRDDARISLAALGRTLGLSHAAIHERVSSLRSRGYLLGEHAQLDYTKLGLSISAYIGLQTRQSGAIRERMAQSVREMPEVEELVWLTGDFDALARVRVRDTTHLQDVVFRLAQAGGEQVRTRTMVVLSEAVRKPGPAFERIETPE